MRKKVCIIEKLLNPKIDYVFKRIFGHVGNEDITKELLSSILNRKVTDLKLDNNPILEKDMLDDKMGILDIKAKIDDSINCDIEMQIVDRRNIEKRILYYWSKMYTSSIKSGGKFKDLQQGIVILISDYELNSLKEIQKYITKWNIREEEYSKIILTDVLEFYILELPKFNKYRKNINNTELDSWIKFIENLEVNDMNDTSENAKAIQKAKQVLEEISQDEHERYLAELREKYIMDQADIEEAGYYKGVQAGIAKEKITIAKKFKEQNVDFEIISKATGLTIDEIKNL